MITSTDFDNIGAESDLFGAKTITGYPVVVLRREFVVVEAE